MKPIFATIIAALTITSCIAADPLSLRTSSTAKSSACQRCVPSPTAMRRLQTSSVLKYPFVVPYPDGFDPEEPQVLPVARQFEADGTFTDLYLGGYTVSYDADCGRTGTNHVVSDDCAASQGKRQDFRKELSYEYQRKYERKAVRVSGADWFKGKIVVKDPRGQ